MNGQIEFNSITGPLTQKEIVFGVYLPKAYQEAPARQFPVIYFLHGLKQDYTDLIEPLAACLETAVETGAAPPMILVTPDGYTDSMWMDSIDGKKPAETCLIKELIPHIETAYPVIPDRENRIIAGFSMGGFGAFRLAFKLPERFGMCISMDGAIHSLKTFKKTRKAIFRENFNDDEEYFNRNGVYALAKKNADTIRASVDFFVLTGVQEVLNDRFRRYMATLNIPIQDPCYIKTGCQHDARQILEKEGLGLFSWIRDHLSQGPGTEPWVGQ